MIQESKFKIGDKVKMRSGYSCNKDDFNYVGYGYIQDKKVTVRRIEKDKFGTFSFQYIYFFKEQSDGVTEECLFNICEDRNSKLKKLGIE